MTKAAAKKTETKKDTKNKPAPPREKKWPSSRPLPVILTPEERSKKSIEMSEILLTIRSLETEKKEQAKEYSDRIGGKQQRATDLARVVKSGKEVRQVKCEVMQDFRTGRYTVTRLDTGEVVHERALTLDERQLPIDDGKKGDGKGKELETRKDPPAKPEKPEE